MFKLIFHPEARQELLDLDDAMKGKALYALDKLELKGNELRYPDTDIIRNGLFELRAGNKDITRTFFAYAKGKNIYILRTYVKKTRKTPQAEIDLAIRRLEELKDED